MTKPEVTSIEWEEGGCLHYSIYNHEEGVMHMCNEHDFLKFKMNFNEFWKMLSRTRIQVKGEGIQYIIRQTGLEEAVDAATTP